MNEVVAQVVTENARTNRYVRHLTTAIAVVVLILTVYVTMGNRLILAELKECTTPGPRKPTAADVRTGHDCFDQSTTRGQALVLQLVCENRKIHNLELPPECEKEVTP